MELKIYRNTTVFSVTSCYLKNGLYESTVEFNLRVERMNTKNTEINMVKVYLCDKFAGKVNLISDSEKFLNITSDELKAKIMAAKNKYEKRKNYHDYCIINEELADKFSDKFEKARHEIITMNIVNTDDFKTDIREYDIKKRVINSIPYSSYYHTIESDNNVFLDENHKVFVNLDLSMAFDKQGKCQYHGINFRTINAFYGHHLQAFYIFSDKTKNLFTMDKQEFMDNMEKIKIRSKDEWKLELFNNDNYINVLWKIFSETRQHFLGQLDIVKDELIHTSTSVIGA
jgi:hypothetical protein